MTITLHYMLCISNCVMVNFILNDNDKQTSSSLHNDLISYGKFKRQTKSFPS